MCHVRVCSAGNIVSWGTVGASPAQPVFTNGAILPRRQGFDWACVQLVNSSLYTCTSLAVFLDLLFELFSLELLVVCHTLLSCLFPCFIRFRVPCCLHSRGSLSFLLLILLPCFSVAAVGPVHMYLSFALSQGASKNFPLPRHHSQAAQLRTLCFSLGRVCRPMVAQDWQPPQTTIIQMAVGSGSLYVSTTESTQVWLTTVYKCVFVSVAR